MLGITPPKRRKEEFYCDKQGGGCGQYFLTYLRTEMYGNYSIRCPNPKCNHLHYRVIKEGLVTGDRHDKRMEGQVEVIIGLLTTLRDTPWTDDAEFRRMQMKVYGVQNGVS